MVRHSHQRTTMNTVQYWLSNDSRKGAIVIEFKKTVSDRTIALFLNNGCVKFTAQLDTVLIPCALYFPAKNFERLRV